MGRVQSVGYCTERLRPILTVKRDGRDSARPLYLTLNVDQYRIATLHQFCKVGFIITSNYIEAKYTILK
jgi:hypothetical protein